MRNYQRCDLVPDTFTIQGAAPLVLGIVEDDVELSIGLWDSSYIGSGANTGRMGGRGDARGGITAVLDLDDMHFNDVPRILPGVRGTMTFLVTANLAGPGVGLPMRIERVFWKKTLEKAVMYGFSVKLDVHATTDGTTGYVTVPRAPLVP